MHTRSVFALGIMVILHLCRQPGCAYIAEEAIFFILELCIDSPFGGVIFFKSLLLYSIINGAKQTEY
jgi:hypothetical protein